MRPFEAWRLFLHPSQRALVEAKFNGPAKVTGAAGTGKTVVAMHRAQALARAGKSVLLTTYATSLKSNIEASLARLCPGEEGERIRVVTVHKQALDLARIVDPGIQALADERVEAWMREAAEEFRRPASTTSSCCRSGGWISRSGSRELGRISRSLKARARPGPRGARPEDRLGRLSSRDRPDGARETVDFLADRERRARPSNRGGSVRRSTRSSSMRCRTSDLKRSACSRRSSKRTPGT